MYRLLVRLGLLKAPFEGIRRVVFAFIALTWLPLAILAIVFQDESSTSVSFWQDLEVHIRLLLSLPIFLLAEPFLHRSLQKTVAEFLNEGMIRGKDRDAFAAILERHERARDSFLWEGILFILAYTLGVWIRWQNIAPDSHSWVFTGDTGKSAFSPAGHWYSAVSIPILQFLQVRWYLRLFQWYGFVRPVSRLELHLTPNHPDRAAGLGFLGLGAIGFAPVLLAHGISLAGMLADHIVFDGHALTSYRLEIAATLLVLLASFLGPLFYFSPRLLALKWSAVHQYGAFTKSFLDAFNAKWICGDASRNLDDLLSTPDIQNHANVGSTFVAVNEMRAVPFERSLVIVYTAAMVVPLLPLALTMYSPAEIFERLIAAMF